MALQPTAVFNCGAFLHVCSRDDIAQAFYAPFSDYHTVVSIQVVPGKVVKVCFASSESTKAVCAEKSYVIDGVECKVLSFAQRVTLVQVHHYPAEADDKDLERVLSDFGDFVEICDQHWVKLTTVTTGTHLSSKKLVRNIPRSLKMEKLLLKVWYKGQLLECDICQKGHKASDCDLRGKCKLCQSSDHFTCTFPTSWGPPAPLQGPDPAPADAPGPDPAPFPPSASVLAPVPYMEVDASAVCKVEDSASQSILQGFSSDCHSTSNVVARDNNGHVSNNVSNNEVNSVSIVSNNVEGNNNESEVTSVTEGCNNESKNEVSNDVSEVPCVTKERSIVSEVTNVANENSSVSQVTDVTNEIVNDNIDTVIEISSAGFEQFLEGIIEEGLPDSVSSEISLEILEDGQLVNTPLAPGKRVVETSSDLDSLDISDWLPLRKRPSRPKKTLFKFISNRWSNS